MTPPALLIRPALRAFAMELRAARMHAGLSRAELARRAGMTRYGLIKVERGGNATLGTIALLAHALGCQIGDFFPRKAPWNAGPSEPIVPVPRANRTAPAWRMRRRARTMAE